MRFHFGVSFRPTKILKYIGLGFLGLLAFMGVYNVNAETIDYTYINVVNGNNQSSLTCNYNSAGMCPTNISMFPQPPKTEYLVKQLFITFGNNQLVSNHNYNFQIQFHILRPTSDNNFEQESFLIRATDNTLYNDNTIYWNAQNYYDSMYGEQATQFNYSGSFTSTKNLPFFVALTFEQQEGMYGIFIDSVYLFDNDTGQEIIDSSTQNTIDLMNNQNQNTQNVINNNNSNTQDIINNQNQNTQQIIDSQQVCEIIDKYSIEINNTQLTGNGSLLANNNVGVTKFVKIVDSTIVELSVNGNEGYLNRFCFYDINKVLISCEDNAIINLIVPPSNAYYFRSNIVYSSNKPSYKVCTSGNNAINNSINDTNQSIQDLNDTISDDTIDTSTSNDFFDNFEDNHHGLSGIVSLPLTTIQSLNNASCTPLTLTIPYLQSNNTLQLPCLTPIYQDNFGVFFTLYQTIIFGFVSYYVCVSIFYMVKDFKDPNKDKIEVMDL